MTETIDVGDHARFLDGYLDAVGRILSTDSILVAAGTRLVVDDVDLQRKLEVQLVGRSRIDEPVGEVESTASKVLGLDNGRLRFYLIEYVEWFLRFVPDAEIWRLDCSFSNIECITSAFFLVEATGKPSVVVYMFTADKSGFNESQSSL